MVAYWLFERHEQLAAVAGVVGGGAPCRVTTWLESAKKNAVLKKFEWTFRKFQFWLWIRPSFWDITA